MIHHIIWAVIVICGLGGLLWFTYNGGSCSLYDCWFTYMVKDRETKDIIPTMIKDNHMQCIYDQLPTVRHYNHYHIKRKGKQCDACLFLLLPYRNEWSKIANKYYHTECIRPIIEKFVIDRCVLASLQSLFCSDVVNLILSCFLRIMLSGPKIKNII